MSGTTLSCHCDDAELLRRIGHGNKSEGVAMAVSAWRELWGEPDESWTIEDKSRASRTTIIETDHGHKHIRKTAAGTVTEHRTAG